MLGDMEKSFNLSEYWFLTYEIELIMGVATVEHDAIS